jgi:hypothetical protein
VQSKGKQLILSGDWNINFLQANAKLQELQIYFLCIMINTVSHQPGSQIIKVDQFMF